MSVQLGRFAKSFKTGATSTDEDCLTVNGNESCILKSISAVAGITITDAAATHDQFIVPKGMKYKQTRMTLRPTTAVVTGSTPGTIKTSAAADAVAAGTLTDTAAIATVSSANLGADTTATTDLIFNSEAISSGSRIVLRHTAASGGSPAGVISVCVFAREVKNDSN